MFSMPKRKKERTVSLPQLWGIERQTRSASKVIEAIQELGSKAYTSQIKEETGMDIRTIREVLSRLSLQNMVHIRQMRIEGRMRHVYFLTANSFVVLYGSHFNRRKLASYTTTWAWQEYERYVDMVDWEKREILSGYELTYKEVERKIFLLLLTTLKLLSRLVGDDIHELKGKYNINAEFYDTHSLGGRAGIKGLPSWESLPVGHWAVTEIWFIFDLYGKFMSLGLENDTEFKAMEVALETGLKKGRIFQMSDDSDQN